jgi:hypothetical protein
MPKLIGTAPNQVPTNGSLGNMAFQNKEGVITDLLSTTALTVTGTGATSFAGTISASLGSAAAPSYTFTGDTNTGMFSPTADTIAFVEGGAEAMRINSVGDVGIGTATPDNYTGRSALSVNGSTGGIITLQSAGTQKLRLFTGASSSAIGTLTGTLDVSTGDASALSFSTNVLERMRIDSLGQVGIGGIASNGTTLRIGKSLTGAAIGLGVYNNQAIQSDVTTSAQLFSTFASTAAAAFTLGSLTHYNAGLSGIGAGSVITSQSGFTASASLVGATNNYGFFGNIPDAAGRWNFYAAGTAPNYFAGKVGIGTTAPNASAMLDVTSTTSGFLPPRMTTVQRDAIATPADGLVVYNTTNGALEARQAGQWVNPATAGIVNTPVAMETDFINEYYASRRSQRTFDQLIDFTRTTSGTFVGSNGLIQTTPASVNLLTFTQEFDNAAWQKSAATATANATVAPDGTSTADKLIATATTTFHGTFQAPTGTVASYTYSVYAKAAEYSKLQLANGTAGTWSATFDLATGATIATGGTAVLSSSIQSVGNGWYRCAVTFTGAAAPAAHNVVGYPNTGATLNNFGASYTGDGVSGVFLWGAQLELGSTATTYTRNNGGRFPARFDYDPVTLRPKGLLIEEQRSNLLLQSQTLNASPWFTNNAGVYTFDPATATAGTELSSTTVPFTVFRDAVTNTTSPTLATVVAGLNYKLEVTVSTNTSTVTTSVRINNSGANVSPSQAIQAGQTGVIVFSFTALASGPLILSADTAGVNLTVTAVSVKELTGGGIVAPDGTSTADKLVEDTTNNMHRVGQSVTTTATAHTATVYAKPAGRDWLYMANASTSQSAYFNVSTGVIGAIVGSTTATITPVGNGWYRCSITSTPAAGAQIYAFYATNANNSFSYTGDGTSGLFLWGTQLEAGAFATSYIPTVASQVTRTGDFTSIVAPNFAPWYNQSEGTFVVEVSYLNASTTSLAATAYSGDPGTTNEYITYLKTSGAINRQSIVVAGVGQGNLEFAGVVAGTVYKMAGAYKLNDVAFSVNGATALTDATVTLPTPNALAIGFLFTNFLNGHVRAIRYYPVRLTNTQLQALST